ncbi:MAG: hypothetical protein H7Z41_05230 [Cytophagales bacterium]|nr:hypothetical protein [Armatimonadota bacterium]
MKYKRCCACDFWVTAADVRCPNCGIQEPRVDRAMTSQGGDTLALETPMTDGTRAAFGGFIGAIIGGFLMDGMGVAVGVAVGVSLGVLLGADREWSSAPAIAQLQNAARRQTASLRQDEETIQQRLTDIASREKRLTDARAKVSVEIGNAPAVTDERDRWHRVHAALDSAGVILARQRERYHAKLWEIALVRWQNTLEPLAADWDALTHESCNHRLRLLEAAVDRGETYLKEWEGVDLTDLPEGQRCVDRLRQALAACAQLREALIVQQAALAVKGIAPMDEALHPAFGPADSLRSLDLFNARAALGEFSSAFGELEAEYARLRSEEELAERATFVQRLR